MKIEVNLEKKYFLAILSAVVILAAVFGVYAYGTNTPSVFGHSAGELAITLSNGSVTNLQNAITNNYIGGGGSAWRSVDLADTISKFNVQCAYMAVLKLGYLPNEKYTWVMTRISGSALFTDQSSGYPIYYNSKNKFSNYDVDVLYESCPAGVTGLTGTFGGGSGGGGITIYGVCTNSNYPTTCLGNPGYAPRCCRLISGANCATITENPAYGAANCIDTVNVTT